MENGKAFPEFPKIENVFERDEASKQLIPGRWRTPEFAYLSECPWNFTEKVDGTNIRVCWNGTSVNFLGRTADAQLPAKLYSVLTALFPAEKFAALSPGTVLYGEGYGDGIQKSGMYRRDQSFILFEALIGGIWLSRDSVDRLAKQLGIDSVPVILTGSLNDAVQFAAAGFKSTLPGATGRAEGLVGKPVCELMTRLGKPVMVKIKTRDLKGFANGK